MKFYIKHWCVVIIIRENGIGIQSSNFSQGRLGSIHTNIFRRRITILFLVRDKIALIEQPVCEEENWIEIYNQKIIDQCGRLRPVTPYVLQALRRGLL